MSEPYEIHMEIVQDFPQIELAIGDDSPEIHIRIDFGSDHLPYKGPYEVRPGLASQTLDTSDCYMMADVLVTEIPIQRISNPYGGKTVIIG